MSYYGAEGDSGWTDPRDQLGHFFIDAITLADTSDPLIDFSLYDAVIIFHAGSDQQNNIPFIYDTPDDFYTGFIIMAEPVMVDNGMVGIQEGTLMPETASQDNRITALNAVMAHEFGHQLGLIDLYNTSNFMTQVGDFALMDNNGLSVGVQLSDDFSSVGGTIPLMPCAWSRAFLGLNVPREISMGEEIPVSAAAQDHSDTEIVKVPITEFEYFLIENRQQDVDTLPHDYPYYLDNALIGDEQTGVILGPGYGVYVNGELESFPDVEYDRLTPGNGLAIWHVDEYVAYLSYTSDPGGFYGTQFNNYQTNTLQLDKDRRFLTIVEADGIIDFGGNYHRGFGESVDLFRLGNNSSFTPYTNPSTHSNLGADSHIFITDISESDTLMTADIEIEWMLPGWPQMGFPGKSSDPILADLDNDDTLEVLVSALNNMLIYRYDGDKFIENDIMISFLNYNNERIILPWGVAGICDTTIIGRPVPADFDGDDTLEVAVATATGYIYLFEPIVAPGLEKAGLVAGFPLKVSDSNLLIPIAVDFDSIAGFEVLAFDDTGSVHLIAGSSARDSIVYKFEGDLLSAAAYSVSNFNVIDAALKTNNGMVISRIAADSGTLAFEPEFECELLEDDSCFIVSADIDRDGGFPEVVAVASNSVRVIETDGSVAWNGSGEGCLGRPAVGDINSDGYPEIVVAGDSKIYAYNFGGSLLSDFPIDLGRFDLSGLIKSAPILADLDNDNNPDIVVGLPDGGIYAFSYKTDRVFGFPLASSFGISNMAAVADLDNDSDFDLVFIEESGYISAWDISAEGDSLDIPWRMSGGNTGNNGYLDTGFEKTVVSNDLQLPANSVYNYPNPASGSTTIRYYLNSDSNVKIDIFDFMGERVHSASLRGTAHMDNEYVWDCSDIASGVYFCRVEADNGHSRKHEIIKIALVK
jgi:M6 family metalloprotease-like protein